MKISSSSPTFVNCSFQRCSATSGTGGAISIEGMSDPVFQRCSFDGNSATLGGGEDGCLFSRIMLTVAAAVSITSGKVQILSSLFVGNFADIHGGGFFMSQGTALIRSTLFVMVRKHFLLFCVIFCCFSFFDRMEPILMGGHLRQLLAAWKFNLAILQQMLQQTVFLPFTTAEAK
jgi:hypothetical protein